MTKKPIRDIPSIKKQREEFQQLEQLRAAFPLIKPFLRLMGADTDTMSAALNEVDVLGVQADVLFNLPDRFNTQFASRGWVIYEALSSTVAEAAVKKAEEGEIEVAEQLLVDYYDEKTLRFHLYRLRVSKTFQPRLRLLYLALRLVK